MVLLALVPVFLLTFVSAYYLIYWLLGRVGFDWRGKRGISPPPAPPPPPPPPRPERPPTLTAEAMAEVRRRMEGNLRLAVDFGSRTPIVVAMDEWHRQLDRAHDVLAEATVAAMASAEAMAGTGSAIREEAIVTSGVVTNHSARPRDPRTGRFISRREVERRRRDGIFIRDLDPGSDLVSYDGGVTWERAPAETAVPTLLLRWREGRFEYVIRPHRVWEPWMRDWRPADLTLNTERPSSPFIVASTVQTISIPGVVRDLPINDDTLERLLGIQNEHSVSERAQDIVEIPLPVSVVIGNGPIDFPENPYLAFGGRMPTPQHTRARGGPWPEIHPPTPEVRLRHKDETGELWEFHFAGWSEDLVFVLVENSTHEPDGSRAKHWLRVRPTVRTAREAVASTFGLTAAQYAPVRET